MSILRFLFGRTSDYDISKINHGDTKERVRVVFGRPDEIKIGGIDAEEWAYTIPFRLFVAISFNSEGLVIQKYRSGEP